MGLRQMLGLGEPLHEGQAVDLVPLVDTAKAAHDRLRAFLRTDTGFARVICRALGCECESEPVGSLAERATQVPGIVRKLTAG